MKVLHVIPSAGPLRGGPSQVVRDLCRGLAQRGVDVTLATTDDNGPYRLDVPLGHMIDEEGFRTIYFPRTSRVYTFSRSISIWLAQHVRDYDFLHTHAAFSFTPMISSYWAIKYNVPYAVTPHGILGQWGFRSHRSLGKRLSFLLIERRLLNYARFVHATSPQEASELRELCSGAAIKMIYLGIDMPVIERYSTTMRERIFPGRENQIVVLFLGRFHAVKGLDLLLPAFAEAVRQKPELVLALAGDGHETYVRWLRSEVQRLRIEDRVMWMGFLSDREKQWALANCDIYVQPSYSESFGLAVLEAMNYSRPILVSNKVAIAQALSEHKAGIVCNPSVDAIAYHLVSLTSNPGLRQNLGTLASDIAKRMFSADKMASDILHTYQMTSSIL